MNCSRCGQATQVRETRAALGGAVARRARICPDGHLETTYEITAAMWRAAQSDIRRKAAAEAYHRDAAQRSERAALMRQDRLGGSTCEQIAQKYGLSLHMARYYTRLPRARLYPAAKMKNAP